MDAQIDHVTGLIMLRERSTKLPLLATPEVFSDISSGFPITGILSHYCGVLTTELPSDGRMVSIDALPGIELQTVAIASKPPPYSPFRGNPRAGDNLALMIHNPATDGRVLYAPGLGAVTPALLTLMASCSVLLLDGTFWTENEMITQGLSKKTAAEMGHLPQSGSGGMIEQLDKLPSSIRKVLIHINNTNPMLIEDGAERAKLTLHGIEVAHDGMDIVF
jgi:pyrroloquinoline quinone biosynthesis protein B